MIAFVKMIARAGLAAGLLSGVSLVAPSLAVADVPPMPGATTTETSLKTNLEKSLQAFNRGDFKTYLHDFGDRLGYNGITVDRTRLVEINAELAESFPNLKMKYRTVRINPVSADEATVTTVAEFTGDTESYDGSGLGATYSESGEVTSFYKRQGDQWITNELAVSWNDSYLDIGRPFGVMGFSTLPPLTSTNQPYRMRVYAGEETLPNMGLSYAYAAVPLATVMSKSGAEAVFRSLKFQSFPTSGLDTEIRAPRQAGTYVHVLVVNKFFQMGKNESLLGQKIYTRMVRVE